MEIAEKVETRKLSDLMMEGAKLHPQGFGLYESFSPDFERSATCAIGAVSEALTGDAIPSWSQIDSYLGYDVAEVTLTHPVNHSPETLIGIIYSLNDVHHWSRESIAEWLRENGY